MQEEEVATEGSDAVVDLTGQEAGPTFTGSARHAVRRVVTRYPDLYLPIARRRHPQGAIADGYPTRDRRVHPLRGHVRTRRLPGCTERACPCRAPPSLARPVDPGHTPRDPRARSDQTASGYGPVGHDQGAHRLHRPVAAHLHRVLPEDAPARRRPACSRASTPSRPNSASVIAHLNERFGTSFVEFPQTDAAVATAFALIDERSRRPPWRRLLGEFLAGRISLDEYRDLTADQRGVVDLGRGPGGTRAAALGTSPHPARRAPRAVRGSRTGQLEGPGRDRLPGRRGARGLSSIRLGRRRRIRRQGRLPQGGPMARRPSSHGRTVEPRAPFLADPRGSVAGVGRPRRAHARPGGRRGRRRDRTEAEPVDLLPHPGAALDLVGGPPRGGLRRAGVRSGVVVRRGGHGSAGRYQSDLALEHRGAVRRPVRGGPAPRLAPVRPSKSSSARPRPRRGRRWD